VVRRLCGELSSLLLVAWRTSDGGSCPEKGSWLRPAPTGLLCGYTGREKGLKGNRNQRNSLSTMEHGKVEIGADRFRSVVSLGRVLLTS
jgi:hypothetical protein